MPARVSACTSIDALTHAVESFVCTRRNVVSNRYSREAFVLIHQAMQAVMRDPDDVEARGDMLLGAAYSGLAIENSMLGAAHAAANPLTAHLGVTHGQAVGLMLPHVIRFNAGRQDVLGLYTELAQAAGLDDVCELIDSIGLLLAGSGLGTTLSKQGLTDEIVPVLAEEAAGQWTASFNPRPVGVDDFVTLYRAAMHGGEG